MPEGTVIKFNTARKALKKTRAEQLATENRIKFGRTKAQKLKDKTDVKKHTEHVNDHKRETD